MAKQRKGSGADQEVVQTTAGSELQLPLGAAEAPPGSPVTQSPLSDGAGLEEQPARPHEVFIPVHGTVRLSRAEVTVIDHPAFQRLKTIYQLGQTHLVFPGATHRRFEHVLGAMHVVQMIVDAVSRNWRHRDSDEQDGVGPSWDAPLTPEEVEFARLGALLHDIGHLPAGHTLEDELGLLPPHDGLTRLNLVLDRGDWPADLDARPLREVIDRTYAGHAAEVSRQLGRSISASEIVLLLVAKDADTVSDQGGFRIGVVRDIIGNTICADLLDYLPRDWHHLGKSRDVDRRLLDYMEVRKARSPSAQASFLINLGTQERTRTDAVTMILELLESRYQLGEVALFHRTKTCAAAMLERAVAEYCDIKGRPDERMLLELLDCSDGAMLDLLHQRLDARNTSDSQKRRRLVGARNIVQNLRARRLHKALLVRQEYDLGRHAGSVQELYAPPRPQDDESWDDHAQRLAQAAKNRLDAVRLLEADFGLEPGDLALYCPPRQMNTKIARVRILVYGRVARLDEFEAEDTDAGLTGGHLVAQKRRFRRLWRVLFAIRPEARAKLECAGLLSVLVRAADLLVLGVAVPGVPRQQAAQELALELQHYEASPLYQSKVPRQWQESVAARTGPLLSYPTNLLSLGARRIPG